MAGGNITCHPDGRTIISSGSGLALEPRDTGRVCFWRVAPHSPLWSWGSVVGLGLLIVIIWRDHFRWAAR